MNGVRVLTEKSVESENRAQRSYLSDSSLSKHLLDTTLVKGSYCTLLSICNRHTERLLFRHLGKHLVIIQT